MEKTELDSIEVIHRKAGAKNTFETVGEMSHIFETVVDQRSPGLISKKSSNLHLKKADAVRQSATNVSPYNKSKPLKYIHDDTAEQVNDPFNTKKSPVLKNQKDSSDFESEIDFSFTKKKKKKKSLLLPENPVTSDEEFQMMLHFLDDQSVPETVFLDINSDYSYDYLLSRFFDLMRENNCNSDEMSRKKLILKPPQVLRAGTKRTSFANFLELCKIMRRTPQHVQSFLIVELGTNGSIDGNGQLVIKGKFHQKQIENVLRRYIREYVQCHTCHSPDTLLLKETRLCFLQCEACRSRCSVPVIKSGFQAVISKRAAIRAKMV